MMKRYFSILLALVISTSIVGCGNANAKSDSANASNNVTVNNVQVESEKVSDISSPEVDNSVTAQATVDEPQLTTESVSSGSLYTLPVGAKGEEWSEAQLDEYLKDCKAYQDNCNPSEKGGIKVDLDALMKDFGFEYVGSSEQEPYAPYNLYWRKVGDLKMVAQFDNVNHLDIYVDNGDTSACVMLGNFSNKDQNVKFSSSNLSGGGHFNKMSTLCLKGYVAVLHALTNSKTFDCGRLPFPADYRLNYTGNGSFGLRNEFEFISLEPVLEEERVYY